eukprot:2735127-Amphidinium_carterae.2
MRRCAVYVWVNLPFTLPEVSAGCIPRLSISRHFSAIVVARCAKGTNAQCERHSKESFDQGLASLANRLLVNGLRRAGFFIGGASEVVQKKSMVTEDYSELWEAQPLEHPRFMQGQPYCSSHAC